MKVLPALILVSVVCSNSLAVADDDSTQATPNPAVTVKTAAVVDTPTAPETKSDAADENKAKPIISLALDQFIQPRYVGAEWLSKSTVYDNGKPAFSGTSREKVIRTKEIDGVTCYQIEFTMDFRTMLDRIGGVKLQPGDITYFWEYFNENGSYDFSDFDTEDSTIEPTSLKDFNLTLPYPVETGHQYQIDDATWEILDNAANIKTPVGEFTCVIYQSTEMDKDDPENSFRQRLYLCPGVGMVRFEMDLFVDGKFSLDTREELVKYNLKIPKVDKESAAE